MLKLLKFLRPCNRYGHWWTHYCSSCAPADKQVETGRRCMMCDEIQLINFTGYSVKWETQKVCKVCNEYCAKENSEFCNRCESK